MRRTGRLRHGFLLEITPWPARSERALARAEALGLKVPLGKSPLHERLRLRATGDAAARREYAAALRC